MPHNSENDWRQKADEARALAKLLRDPETKKLMLTIASAYNALVQHYERGARPRRGIKEMIRNRRCGDRGTL